MNDELKSLTLGKEDQYICAPWNMPRQYTHLCKKQKYFNQPFFSLMFGYCSSIFARIMSQYFNKFIVWIYFASWHYAGNFSQSNITSSKWNLGHHPISSPFWDLSLMVSLSPTESNFSHEIVQYFPLVILGYNVQVWASFFPAKVSNLLWELRCLIMRVELWVGKAGNDITFEIY